MGFKSHKAYIAYHRTWRARNKAHLSAWRKAHRGQRGPQHRKDRYGLTHEAFNAMVAEQDGKCGICEKVPCGAGKLGILHVDHDHITGSIRGLLCHHCNAALGGFGDSAILLRKAAMYLGRHAADRHTG